MKQVNKGVLKRITAFALAMLVTVTAIPSISAVAETTDVTPPVIESVSFTDDGKTISIGDTLTFEIDAYDQDSSIVKVEACFNTTDNTQVIAAYYPESGTDKINGSITMNIISNLTEALGGYALSYVRVYDSYGNMSYCDDVAGEIEVERNYLDGTSAELTLDSDALIIDEDHMEVENTLSVALDGINSTIASVSAVVAINPFKNVSTFMLTLNETTEEYEYTFSFNQNLDTDITYTIFDICVETEDGDIYFIKSFDQKSFTVVNEISDNERPQITRVHIDKNHELVESGEVTFSISATDEFGMSSESAYLILSSPLDNVNDVYVELVMGEEGRYTGKVDVSTLYPCEWYISKIIVWDKMGNASGYSYLMDNAYFFVTRNGVFTDKVYKDVTFNFRDAEGKLLKAVTMDVSRRATFEVVKSKLNLKVADSEKYGKFVGWRDYDYNLYEDATEFEFLYDKGIIDIYAQHEKYAFSAFVYYLDKNGESKLDDVFFPVEEDTTVEDVMKILPTPENSGYKFTGWEAPYDDLGDLIEDQTLFVANYETYPAIIEVYYIDKDGKLAVYDSMTGDVPAGTTPKEVWDNFYKSLDDATKSKITGYKDFNVHYAFSEDINVIHKKIVLAATYEDKNLVQYNYRYIKENGTYGKYVTEYGVFIATLDEFEDDTLIETHIYEELKKKNVAHEDSFKFLKFEILSAGGVDDDDCFDNFDIEATYDNIIGCIIRNSDSIYFPLKAGDVLDLDQFAVGDCKVWFSYFDGEYVTGKYTVPNDLEKGIWLEFDLQGDFEYESEVRKPVVELEKETVEEIKTQITDAIKELESSSDKKPEPIVIEMKKEDGTVATVVPKDILETMKGKDVEVVLDMGDYSWTISGESIKATNLEDINLEVELNTNNIPSTTVEKIAGDNPTYQLSLTHEGPFGFKADLSINVGKDNAGKYGNLYYYRSDGTLVCESAGIIDENGNVSLGFSHASEYVVVIADESQIEIPNTGDGFTYLYIAGLILLGAGVVFVAAKKRFGK